MATSPNTNALGRPMSPDTPVDENGNPLVKQGTPPAQPDRFSKYGNENKLLNTETDGIVTVEHYPNRWVMKDAETGEVIQTGSRNNQFMTPAHREILQQASGQVLYPEIDYGTFGTQSQSHTGDGTYTASNGTQLNWQDFKNRHGDWIDKYYSDKGGVDAFIKAVQDPAKTKEATLWFQNQVNAFSREKYGKDWFELDGKHAAALDGKFGQVTWSVPRFFEQPQPPEEEQEETPETPEIEVTDQGFEQVADKSSDEWWLQDVAHMAASLTDPVNRYEPMQQQVDLQEPEYSLLDPSRQVAAMQEQGQAYNDLVQNTSSGQVARANMQGMAGQSAGQIADVLANYENQNVGISNQAAAQAAGIYNQEQQMNAQLDDQYVTRMATLNQQYDNALRERKYRQLDAFVNGATNNMHKKMLEQVVFPDVHIDPWTFDTTVDPSGRDFRSDFDTYQSPHLGNRNGADQVENAQQLAMSQKAYYDQLVDQGFNPDQALQLMQKNTRNITGEPNEPNYSRRQQWAQSIYGGRR